MIIKRSMRIAEVWPELAPGMPVECVKVEAHGEVIVRYPGRVVDLGVPESWVAVKAFWDPAIHKRVIDLNGLRFVPGDDLHEYFSSVHPYNCFSVFAPDGSLRGWYANVTFPTRIDGTQSPPRLYWHDLYLDVVMLPDGQVFVRDEDELEEAGLESTDPRFFAEILAVKNELVGLAKARAFPFHE
jgi:protein associated with RNAse G/E